MYHIEFITIQQTAESFRLRYEKFHISRLSRRLGNWRQRIHQRLLAWAKRSLYAWMPLTQQDQSMARLCRRQSIAEIHRGHSQTAFSVQFNYAKQCSLRLPLWLRSDSQKRTWKQTFSYEENISDAKIYLPWSVDVLRNAKFAPFFLFKQFAIL